MRFFIGEIDFRKDFSFRNDRDGSGLAGRFDREYQHYEAVLDGLYAQWL